MKIFLVGATGRTGQWILKSALARGCEVTALVRQRASREMTPQHRLQIIDGDLLKIKNLEKVMVSHEIVISALSSDVVEQGTRILIAAAEKAFVRRFIGLAGGGILQLDETRLRRERPGYPALFVKTSAGHLASWRALEKSSLLWTLVCTPDLANAPATGLAKHREDYMPEGGRSIPCGDVAEFMMDEITHARFVCKRVGLTV